MGGRDGYLLAMEIDERSAVELVDSRRVNDRLVRAGSDGPFSGDNCFVVSQLGFGVVVLKVHSGVALPLIEEVGIGPKYRPSNDAGSLLFIRNMLLFAMMVQPCQTGSERPHASLVRAFPINTPSTKTRRPKRQMVWRGIAATCLMSGVPWGSNLLSAKIRAQGSGGTAMTMSFTRNVWTLRTL